MHTPDRQAEDDRIAALIAAAVGRPGGEPPADWLRRACGADDRLWAVASAVLANFGPDGKPKVAIFSPAPPTAVAAAAGGGTAGDAAGDARVGDRVGPYTLARELGRGGHGVVFQADQAVPARAVAVKVLLPGVDTDEVLRRFDRERQVMAALDHPHIAKVFGAGSVHGRPYFAMELVPAARPITDHCDAARLGVRGRVALLSLVCRAIDHAYGRGVVHRDLKPSNVLVARADDGSAVPKVIDFGIAKATDPAARGGPPLTPLERPTLGTWEYMSPEQADPDGAEVDTRADVYSLGAVLYELLTGTPPLDPRELRSEPDEGRRRRVRHDVPPAPSKRLARVADPAQVAADRGTDPKQLARQLARELDWVVLRALEKERGRRYATPGGLADDLDRYLAGEAVVAVPPRWSYVARKWARRNRAVVAVMATLVVATVATAAAATVAVRQRHRADVERRAADEQRAVAVAERTYADGQLRAAIRKDQAAVAIFNFMAVDVLAGVMPGRLPDPAARQAVVKAMLEPSLSVIDARFAGQPRARAAVQHAMAAVLFALARPDLALPLARRAADTRQVEYGPADVDTLRSAVLLAACLESLDRAAEAQSWCLDLLPLIGRPEHVDATTRELPYLFGVYLTHANTLLDQGRYGEAVTAARTAWDHERQAAGDNAPGTVEAQGLYADALVAAGHPDAAEPVARAALAPSAAPAAVRVDQITTDIAAIRLARALHALGRDAEAERYLRPARDRLRQVLGDTYPSVLTATDLLAVISRAQGRPADAERLARDGLAASRGAWGDDHHLTLRLQIDLAGIERDAGHDADAERLARDAHDRAARVWGDDHPLAIEADVARAAALTGSGRAAEAEPIAKDADIRAARTLGDAHPLTVAALRGHAAVLRSLGRGGDADAFLHDHRSTSSPTTEPAATAAAARPAD